uniref:Uncharacterized protein n=1 Tax=Leersia perrieri TaxID=77586 RepID=A0A0D9XG04_9ORYZ
MEGHGPCRLLEEQPRGRSLAVAGGQGGTPSCEAVVIMETTSSGKHMAVWHWLDAYFRRSISNTVCRPSRNNGWLAVLPVNYSKSISNYRPEEGDGLTTQIVSVWLTRDLVSGCCGLSSLSGPGQVAVVQSMDTRRSELAALLLDGVDDATCAPRTLDAGCELQVKQRGSSIKEQYLGRPRSTAMQVVQTLWAQLSQRAGSVSGRVAITGD